LPSSPVYGAAVKPNGLATHVELDVNGLRTGVRFPPPPPTRKSLLAEAFSWLAIELPHRDAGIEPERRTVYLGEPRESEHRGDPDGDEKEGARPRGLGVIAIKAL